MSIINAFNLSANMFLINDRILTIVNFCLTFANSQIYNMNGGFMTAKIKTTKEFGEIFLLFRFGIVISDCGGDIDYADCALYREKDFDDG